MKRNRMEKKLTSVNNKLVLEHYHGTSLNALTRSMNSSIEKKVADEKVFCFILIGDCILIRNKLTRYITLSLFLN